MKEQLISFDTAKLAKEKGFNIRCNDFINIYNAEDELMGFIGDNFDEKYSVAEDFIDYFIPGQSLLQKWLREVHNIILVIAPIHETEDIKSLIKYWYYIIDVEDDSEEEDFYGSWEQALEFGLQESLKLIK